MKHAQRNRDKDEQNPEDSEDAQVAAYAEDAEDNLIRIRLAQDQGDVKTLWVFSSHPIGPQLAGQLAGDADGATRAQLLFGEEPLEDLHETTFKDCGIVGLEVHQVLRVTVREMMEDLARVHGKGGGRSRPAVRLCMPRDRRGAPGAPGVRCRVCRWRLEPRSAPADTVVLSEL